MSKKSEFKKYRKNAFKEINYQSVYADSIIETKQGFFTKMYLCVADIMVLFDLLHRLCLSDVKTIECGLDTMSMQITYYEDNYYLTVGVKSMSYDDSVKLFAVLDEYNHVMKSMSFKERMTILHSMYQNDDSLEDRFKQFACKKGETTPPVDFADCMKNFKKNKKISKDLILPLEMYENSTEFEFAGNYVRFFYLKNTPRYLTKEFFEEMKNIENLCFSIHLKPMEQTQIVEYVETKFKLLKDLKKSELQQKQFFDQALPELKKSAKRNEKMFLVTMIFGIADDSIDVLDAKVKHLVREFEKSYVIKELKFQQKNAFQTFLPFCEDKLDIQTTIYKKNESIE